MSERGPRFETSEAIAKGMGDWTHETSASHTETINTHVVRGIPEVAKEIDPGLLEKLRQPTAKKVISFLLIAAAAGAYIGWFTGSEIETASASRQIEQESFEAQKMHWLEKMHEEHLTEQEIKEVLSDPELKQVFEEMANGTYLSFDEYMAIRASSGQ